MSFIHLHAQLISPGVSGSNYDRCCPIGIHNNNNKIGNYKHDLKSQIF